jgi:hypothetical protein
MADQNPNISQFSKAIGKDPSYVSRICKRLNIEGSPDPRNPRSRLLSIDDRAKLLTYFGESSRSSPEPVPNYGSVDMQVVEAELVEAGENVALSFPVVDRSATTAAVRADALAVAATTQSNIGAFRSASRQRVEQMAREMAAEDFQILSQTYQAELNSMMAESLGAEPDTAPASVSVSVKKDVGQSSPPS